jgi:hypothetical protein
MTYKIFFLSIFFSLVILSCKKEDVKPVEIPAKYGNFLLKFDNRVGKEELSLFNTSYTTPSGENVKIEAVQYFISNVALEKEDGSFFTMPSDSCQFLMREDDFFQQWFLLKNIPEGIYKSISLSIGIEKPNIQNPIFDKNGKAKDLFLPKQNTYSTFFIKSKKNETDSLVYKIISPNPLKIMKLSFGEYRSEIKESAFKYSSSAHIFCDITPFLKNNLSNTEQQNALNSIFEVNHVENK